MQHSRIRFAITALALISLPLASFALTLPGLPQNMCPLDASVPAEKVVLDYMTSSNQGTNEVVTVFADCNELKALAAGQRPGLDHYGSVLRQTQLSGITSTRAEYLASAKDLYSGSDAMMLSALNSARDINTNGMAANSLSPVSNMNATSKGVLHQDANVVVMGAQQSHSIGGKTITVSSTAGLTLIGSTPVSVNLYAPASEPNASANASASLTNYVAALVKANP